MSYGGDIQNAGVAFLQHHDPRVPIASRSVQAGIRLIARDPHTGAPIFDDDSYGDRSIGWVLWRDKSRGFCGWARAWAVAVHTPNTFPDIGLPGGAGQGGANELLLPLRYQNHDRDDRFIPQPSARPEWGGGFPGGWPGLVVGATHEDAQNEIWIPGGWGLVSSDHATNLGTRIVGVDASGHIDETLWCRLHQFIRILRVGFVANNRISASAGGVIRGAPAWVLGETPTGEFGFGLAIGPDSSPGTQVRTRGREIASCFSHLQRGFLHAGDGRCQHQGVSLGTGTHTADNIPVKPGHAWAGGAFMTGSGAREFADAALGFLTGEFPQVVEPMGGTPHLVRCQRGFSLGDKIEPGQPDYWGWSVQIMLDDEVERPPWLPQPPPLKPNPSLAGPGSAPASGPIKSWKNRPLLTTCGRELGVPSIAFVPQPLRGINADHDHRHNQRVSQDDIRAMRERPVVAAWHAVGWENGRGAWDGQRQACNRHGWMRPWVSGLLVLLPGPVGPEHYDESTPYQLDGATMPTVGEVFPDGAQLNIGGRVNIAEKRHEDGHRLTGDGGDLVVSRIASNGASSERLRLLADGELQADGLTRISHNDVLELESANGVQIVGGLIAPSIVSEAGSGDDIEITPDGSADLILDGQKWPQADGSAGQTLETDGSAQLSWQYPRRGPWGHGTGTTTLSSDTTLAAGAHYYGDLDLAGYDLSPANNLEAVYIFVSGTLSNSGGAAKIHADGLGQAAGTVGAGGIQSSSTPPTAAGAPGTASGYHLRSAGAGGGGGGGGDGSVGAAGRAGDNRNSARLDGAGGGSAGSAGGLGAAGGAGGNGSAVGAGYSFLGPLAQLGGDNPMIGFGAAGGSGGGGGYGAATSDGGAGGIGGAGGGVIVIVARRIVWTNLSVTANGGDGDDGADGGVDGGGGGGGAGGAGGTAIVIMGESSAAITSVGAASVSIGGVAKVVADRGSGGSGGAAGAAVGGAGGTPQDGGRVFVQLWGAA